MRREAEKAAAVVPAPAQVRVSRRARLAAHRAVALAAGWRAARAQSQWVDRAVDSCRLIRRVEDGCGRGLRKGVPMGPQTDGRCVGCSLTRLRRRSRRQMAQQLSHRRVRSIQQNGYRMRRLGCGKRSGRLMRSRQDRIQRHHRHLRRSRQRAQSASASAHSSCRQRCFCSDGGSYSGGGA